MNKSFFMGIPPLNDQLKARRPLIIRRENLELFFGDLDNRWMDLNEIRVFVKVVQAGSFSLAAKQLGMPNSPVSARVSALERRLDLIAEGVDVAIRAGELKDSGLIAKKLGRVCWAAYASPAYLKRAGTPAHPKDLRQHACLQFTSLGKDNWQLTGSKHSVSVPLASRVIGND